MVTPVEHGTVGCFHLWLASVGGTGSIGIEIGMELLNTIKVFTYNIYKHLVQFVQLHFRKFTSRRESSRSEFQYYKYLYFIPGLTECTVKF